MLLFLFQLVISMGHYWDVSIHTTDSALSVVYAHNSLPLTCSLEVLTRGQLLGNERAEEHYILALGSPTGYSAERELPGRQEGMQVLQLAMENTLEVPLPKCTCCSMVLGTEVAQCHPVDSGDREDVLSSPLLQYKKKNHVITGY